jgi:hypothetical protein
VIYITFDILPDKISMKVYPRGCNILKNIILIEKKYYPIEEF